MKALRKTAKGVGHVALCDVPVPQIGPHDVLMQVYAAGVCGSDLLIQEDRHFYRAPVTLGHEFSGIAYQVGKDVTRVNKGDKFVADIECGAGEWLGVTLDGAYAPFMRVPEHVIYRVPDHVSLEHACLAEPIVATHHLIQERAQVKVGDDVVVITHHYELKAWEEAFANLRAKQDVKALIHPHGRGWAD
jgi:L-iditol 2-dehydrogenase